MRAVEQDSWLVVGLGNPGPDYAATRHNIGQMVVDELAGRIGSKPRRHKARASVATGRASVFGPRFILAKPHTYMNVSGGPVAALAKFYKLAAANIIVVHDDLDIPFDRIKLKRGGGDAGHNGLKSVSAALGTKDYLRVRVGISRPPGRMDPASYVLKRFSPDERRNLASALSDAADAVEMLAESGLEKTQLNYHG